MSSRGMHLVTANYFYDRELADPDALFAAYRTLTGWAEGVTRAGARVTVVQRWSRDDCVDRKGVRYQLVRCPTLRMGSILDSASALNRAVVRLVPDVIHANGIRFGRQAARLKRRLPDVPLLLQDHADRPPRRALDRLTLRRALGRVDAFSFAAREQARPWVDAALIGDGDVLELMEGSTDLRAGDRQAARAATGLEGDPVCLWVGRLDANKDPLTVLAGFAKALALMPAARLYMVYASDDLLADVERWLSAHPAAAAAVRLLGERPHADLEALYNSADFLLLGSHHEGSGYAVLEAMACGVVPIVTDIPSFRRLTGGGAAGGLWPVGDPDALARMLVRWHGRRSPSTPARIAAFFEDHWSFAAIGREAAGVYDALRGKAARRP